MKKLILIIILLAVVGGAAGAYYMRQGVKDPEVRTAQVSRGDIVDVVAATGTLEAVTTVQVGTQVGGIVQELYADFNDIVKKGQVIARLDPTLLQTQIDQQRANVIRSEADLDRLKVSLADAKQKLERAKLLSDKQLLPKTELETAIVNVQSSEAQIKSSEAALTQAKSQLNSAEVNKDHTVITAPIDGIVISRQVEPGQTVNAGMSAPTLFILAADLTKMQVNANIDESDVGRMRPGQVVTFGVDAYPTETFIGSVEQVRLQPTTVQNVVTYQTVIAAPNPERKLKPGMTAKVNIEINRKSNVLRIPSAATRFRPSADVFAALHQEVPPEAQRGGGAGGRNAGGGRNGGGGRNANGAPQGAPGAVPGAPAAGAPPAGAPPAAAPGAAAPQANAGGQGQRQPRPGQAEATGGGDRMAGGAPGGGNNPGGGRMGGGGGGGRGGFDPNMTPEERQKAREARMAAMTPEERAAFEARMAARGQGGQGGQGGGRGGFGGGQGQGGGGGFAGGQGQGNRQSAANATGAPGAPRDSRQGRVASVPTITGTATSIDALFGPLPTVETRGRVWLYIDKRLKAVSLRLGISDGTNTEVLDDAALQVGQEVVTSVLLPSATAAPAGAGGAGQNPLMGPQRGGPGGGRGGPGGGRGF